MQVGLRDDVPEFKLLNFTITVAPWTTLSRQTGDLKRVKPYPETNLMSVIASKLTLLSHLSHGK